MAQRQKCCVFKPWLVRAGKHDGRGSAELCSPSDSICRSLRKPRGPMSRLPHIVAVEEPPAMTPPVPQPPPTQQPPAVLPAAMQPASAPAQQEQLVAAPAAEARRLVLPPGVPLFDDSSSTGGEPAVAEATQQEVGSPGAGTAEPDLSSEMRQDHGVSASALGQASGFAMHPCNTLT